MDTMQIREEIISRDYYPPTKLIGFFCNLIVKKSKGKIKRVVLLRFVLALLIFGFLAFGIPLIVGYFANDFFFTSWELILAFCWLFIAAVLIDLFEYAIDDFWDKYKEICKMEEKDFLQFKNEYNKKIFSRKYLILSISLYVIGFIYMPEILHEYSLAILITVDILMIPAAIMWGIIGYLTLYMYSFSFKICEQNIDINPFHPDGFGGLSALGNLPLRTASFVSSASLYIPYGINRMREFGMQTVVGASSILAVSVVSTIILLTFVVPLLPVHKLAKKVKYDLLMTIGNRLRSRLEAFEKCDMCMERDIELLLAYYNYNSIKEMKVWPFNTRTLFEIFCYIILPVLLFLAGIFLH